jgi:hypothetical protein
MNEHMRIERLTTQFPRMPFRSQLPDHRRSVRNRASPHSPHGRFCGQVRTSSREPSQISRLLHYGRRTGSIFCDLHTRVCKLQVFIVEQVRRHGVRTVKRMCYVVLVAVVTLAMFTPPSGPDSLCQWPRDSGGPLDLSDPHQDQYLSRMLGSGGSGDSVCGWPRQARYR